MVGVGQITLKTKISDEEFVSYEKLYIKTDVKQQEIKDKRFHLILNLFFR